MKTVRNLLLLLLSVQSMNFHAQDKFSDNLYLRTDAHFGLLIPEYQLFNQIANDYIYSGEISLQKQSSGKHDRDQLYNYPEFGVTLLYSTLGNDQIFGHETALYGYFLTHLFENRVFQLNQQFGLGLGYASRKFNLQDNYMNVAVGSHINIHFNYKLGVSLNVSERFRINSGLSFSHYSNANMAEPNLGVNTFTTYLGSNYLIGKKNLYEKRDQLEHRGGNEFAIIGAIGGKHTRALQSTIYFTSSVSGEYRRQISRKIRLGAGVDIFYDSSTETEMSVPGKEPYRPFNDYRTGIHLSQEIAYGDFSFLLQEGLYIGLTNTVDPNRAMYNRGIVRWRMNEKFLIQITMKSHLHILDYPEFGFGYWFKTPKK